MIDEGERAKRLVRCAPDAGDALTKGGLDEFHDDKDTLPGDNDEYLNLDLNMEPLSAGGGSLLAH